MLGGGLLGVMIERFAYRRLRNAPRIAPLITALGVSFFLENARAAHARRAAPELQQLQLAEQPDRAERLHAAGAGAGRATRRSSSWSATIVLVVVLTLFVQRTQTGKAMRATSFDREAAAMMGIDVDRVIVVTFFIGSALAGAAGVFNGIAYQQVWPYMGFQAGLFAFTAAVVGGIGNLPGAVLGGLADRARRVVRDRLPLIDVPAGDRLRDPDRGDARPAERPPRPRGGAEGLMDGGARHPADPGAPDEAQARRSASTTGSRRTTSGASGARASLGRVQARARARAAAGVLPRLRHRRGAAAGSSRTTGTSSASASTRCSTCCSRSA